MAVAAGCSARAGRRPLRRTPYRTTARRHPERATLEPAAAGAAKVLGALKTKCTSCDDRHIGARKDALYLNQENWGNYPSTHRRRNHVLAQEHYLRR